MSKKVLPSLFAVFLFIASIRGQNNVTFNHLTIENGLSQSSVMCILQDKDGFMWFGTQDGLNRYDGYNIKIFKNNPSDSTSLINNFILGLFEDSSGNMYVESQGGFQKYNPLAESFAEYEKTNLKLRNARFNSVNAFFEDTTGIQWLGGLGSGTGLKMVDKSTGKINVFKHSSSDPSSLSDNKVYSVYRDRSGNLWVGTFNGLDKLDENTGKFTHYRNKTGDQNSLSDNWVWPIFEDSNGNLWIGTVRGGLNKFNPNTETFENFSNDPLNPGSLSDNFIFSIYQDRSGVIWIGTQTSGVNYFLPSAQVFEVFRSKPDDKNWFSENSIQSMYVDRNESYWIGTQGGGLYKFNYNKNSFERYSHNPSSTNSISSNTVLSMYEDKSGVLWIGNFDAGLDAFNLKDKTFKHYKYNPSDSNSISDNRIYSIFQGRDGNIWIGTYRGGLNKLNPNTGKINIFQHEENNPKSISSNYVSSIVEDDSGKLWVGTGDGGLNLFNPANNTAEHFINDPKDPESLVGNDIMTVFIDSKNNIWIGTTKGLSEFNRKTKKFSNYRSKEGLPNETVFGILEDNQGNLWLSTNKGLSRFNPKTKIFKNFYSQNGLQGDEFNQNAFAKDHLSGRLMFGGTDGFNVFDPEKVKENSYVPPIVFTNFLRYNTDDEEGKPIVEKGVSEMNKLSLTYKDNIVTLEFAALSYYNSFNNQYKYKLEGFNENWIQLGTNNNVTFTNLSQGDYVLKVIGSNNDGVWNEEGASLNIHVSPPWWKTNIAYGIYLIAFFAFLYGVRKFELDRREKKAQIRESALRIKATEAEKRALEIENERKTKELEEARQLQLSMLPKKLPELPNIEIAAFMRTATEVGGDYYDFRQDNGSLYVAFGDATGHGLQAGTMVTLMKGFFTSDSSKLGMQEFMNHCSKMIKEIELGRILMSFSYLKIEGNKMQVTSAGMPPIYYNDNNTGQVEEIVIQGMPLGAMKSFPYKVFEKEIHSGDTLLLLTDGLPEQMNSNEEMFDYTRVKDKFSEFSKLNPRDIIDKLVIEGDNWMNGAAQADDITFVVIKFR